MHKISLIISLACIIYSDPSTHCLVFRIVLHLIGLPQIFLTLTFKTYGMVLMVFVASTFLYCQISSTLLRENSSSSERYFPDFHYVDEFWLSLLVPEFEWHCRLLWIVPLNELIRVLFRLAPFMG